MKTNLYMRQKQRPDPLNWGSAHTAVGQTTVERKARRKLRELFEEECERIFFPRQLATIFEDEFFHW